MTRLQVCLCSNIPFAWPFSAIYVTHTLTVKMHNRRIRQLQENVFEQRVICGSMDFSVVAVCEDVCVQISTFEVSIKIVAELCNKSAIVPID